MAQKKEWSVPLSQDDTKLTSGSREEVIAELRMIAERDPTRVITRNFFRVNSRYAESAWNKHYGTFHEFKRQAGIVLSRHQHRMERDIAKHASVDVLRNLNLEKAGREGTYRRPSNRRWQSVLVASDVHDITCDPFYLRVIYDTAERLQPEQIVLNGDIFDLPEFGKYPQDPREYQPLKRITWVHDFLATLRKRAPDATITYTEGNHEFRLLRHMAEATPALMTVLSDLHGFTVPKLLGLDKFEVNFVARADLTAWNEAGIKTELRKNYVTLYDALLFGHFPEQRHMGYPGANGHHHRHALWSAYSPVFGPYEWHQIGCGHRREARYTPGEQWGNGFLICHVDTATKRTQFEYVDVTHEHAVVGGKFYCRTEAEPVSDTHR